MFAARHGDRLRSLVLDGAYPVPGTDPAFSDLGEATQRALRLVCARRPSCAARGEDPVAVFQRLVERVRARPVTGSGLDADGKRVRVRLDETSLAALVQSGYVNVPMYRADFVEHTQELAVTMPALSGVNLVLSTEGQRPEAVADRIRRALPSQLVAPVSSRR